MMHQILWIYPATDEEVPPAIRAMITMSMMLTWMTGLVGTDPLMLISNLQINIPCTKGPKFGT
jgi:hypothetical protein